MPKRIGAPNAANPPNPILPRKLNKIKFLDVDPMEIARHLTIMDSRLCMRITPDECLSKAWPKLFKNECKNITAMITFNNAVSWACTFLRVESRQLMRLRFASHSL